MYIYQIRFGSGDIVPYPVIAVSPKVRGHRLRVC